MVSERFQCTGEQVRIVAIENPDLTGSPRGQPADVRPAQVFLAEKALLRRIAAGLGLRSGDAEDVLQTVSLKCLRHARAFADRDACRRWLIRVTTNECVTEHRRVRRFRRHAGKLVERRRQSRPDGPVESALSAERLAAVQGALDSLDDGLLRPLVLKYFCDLTSAEIGEILDMPAPTVRSMLCKGRLALAKALAKRGIER
jgi:RNA polymerase sigma-70 factor (ECF subfamily)